MCEFAPLIPSNRFSPSRSALCLLNVCSLVSKFMHIGGCERERDLCECASNDRLRVCDELSRSGKMRVREDYHHYYYHDP
jgi:hypothetical protein